MPCVSADRNGNITNVSLVFDLVVEGFLLVHIRLEVLYALVDIRLEVEVFAVAFVIIASAGTFHALRVLVVIVAVAQLGFLNVALGAVEVVVNLLDIGGSRRIVERTIQMNSLESIDRIVKVTSIWWWSWVGCIRHVGQFILEVVDPPLVVEDYANDNDYDEENRHAGSHYYARVGLRLLFEIHHTSVHKTDIAIFSCEAIATDTAGYGAAHKVFLTVAG